MYAKWNAFPYNAAKGLQHKNQHSYKNLYFHYNFWISLLMMFRSSDEMNISRMSWASHACDFIIFYDEGKFAPGLIEKKT